MLDLNHINANVDKSQAIAGRLRDLGVDDREVVGHLGVDLGDLYTGVERFKDLIDQLLQMAVSDREAIGDVLADLSVELRHIDYHAKSSVGSVDALAEEFD